MCGGWRHAKLRPCAPVAIVARSERLRWARQGQKPENDTGAQGMLLRKAEPAIGSLLVSSAFFSSLKLLCFTAASKSSTRA
jgi:hypothetical protein